MSDLLEERLQAASAFLLQSPPGELNDVFTDLRSLVQDDQALERSILPALKQYNLEQFVVSTLQSGSGAGKKVIVTPVSQLPSASSANTTPEGASTEGEERHVDYRQGISFAFNHMNSTASDPQPLSPSDSYDSETLSILQGIDPLFQKHVENHYNDGVCSIYPLEDSRYPQPEPEQVQTAQEEPEEKLETGAEEETAGSLAEGLPENEKESAEVAKETADAAEEALGEGNAAGAPTTEAASTPMDLGTPADQPAEAGGETATETETGTGMDDETKAEEAEKPVEEKVEEAEVQNEKEVVVERPPKTSRLFGLYLVGNKYNPNNYWTGRWRSKYEVDYETGKIDGTAMINIHYYEQGNVQLSTTLHSSAQLSPSPSPEEIIASLKSSEQTFSTSLSSTYSELSDETFKGLRRALPKTRSKIDWNKAGGYRLGAELGGSSAQ
ncbi:hypothetical protein JCM3765_002210 [Sporobolomyces pararoseus]